MNKDAKSPIAGKLSASKSLAGRISRVTFNRALSTALGGGILADMDTEERYRLILNYLNAFDAELDKKKLLLRSAFFEAIFDLFDEVVRATVNASGNAKKEALQDTIRPIAKVDYSGQTTKKAILTLMQTALRARVSGSPEICSEFSPGTNLARTSRCFAINNPSASSWSLS